MPTAVHVPTDGHEMPWSCGATAPRALAPAGSESRVGLPHPSNVPVTAKTGPLPSPAPTAVHCVGVAQETAV